MNKIIGDCECLSQKIYKFCKFDHFYWFYVSNSHFLQCSNKYLEFFYLFTFKIFQRLFPNHWAIMTSFEFPQQPSAHCSQNCKSHGSYPLTGQKQKAKHFIAVICGHISNTQKLPRWFSIQWISPLDSDIFFLFQHFFLHLRRKKNTKQSTTVL